MPRFRYSEKHGDLIGAHLSTKGGLHTVFERATALNVSAVALFAKNSNQWKGKELTDDHCALFAQKRSVKPVFSHVLFDQSGDNQRGVSSQIDCRDDRRARSRR